MMSWAYVAGASKPLVASRKVTENYHESSRSTEQTHIRDMVQEEIILGVSIVLEKTMARNNKNVCLYFNI